MSKDHHGIIELEGLQGDLEQNGTVTIRIVHLGDGDLLITFIPYGPVISSNADHILLTKMDDPQIIFHMFITPPSVG